MTVGPPAQRSDAPESDAFEDAWRCYYENIFNPARLNPKAMRQHMPEKYWRNLPEAASIAGLVQQAPERAREMIAREAAEREKRDPLKAVAAMAEQGPQTLEELNRLIAASEPLSPGADRAVLGEGPMEPAVAFVGEQPGDQEEREGRPFIGPAGQLFDKALAEAGIDRSGVYVTNAVKHFKYEPRGKKRLHKRPNPGEVKRYRWWLHRELAFVRPRLVVAMGGTALLGLTGKPLSVLKMRGPMTFDGQPGYATVHPSYLLRLPDEAAQREAYAAFRDDLVSVRRLIAAKRLVRGLLVEEFERAVAALALEVAEGAGAGGDQLARLVVDLGFGGEGALAGRGSPGAEDREHVAVARRLDELRGEGERHGKPPRRRRLVEGAGEAAGRIEQASSARRHAAGRWRCTVRRAR